MLRKVIRIAIYLILASVVTVLAVLFILYRHTPNWYRPVRLSETELQDVSTFLNSHLLNLYDKCGTHPEDQPFVMELTQDRANGYLQALPALYRQEIRLPAGLTDPMIVFRKDRLILAGRYAKLGGRPISVHLKLRVEPDRVAVTVDSIQAGSLPLPRQFVRDQLSELRYRLKQATGRYRDAGGNPSDGAAADLAKLGRAFFLAIDGEPMEREFIAKESKRRVRVERVELDEGKLTLTFVPQGPAPDLPAWLKDR